MTDDLTEFHGELRAVARELLGRTVASASSSDPVEVDWQLVAESGWPGLEVPEELDGAGATFAEVAVVAEELGRAAAAGPFLGTVVQGVGALVLLEANAGRNELLRSVAAGTRRVAVASATDGSAEPCFWLEAGTDGLRLHGQADFVPDAPVADDLLLPAVDPDGRTVIVHAQADTGRISVREQPVLDATRRLGAVVAAGAPVGQVSVWRFAHDGDAGLRHLADRAALAIACDSFGLSQVMLEATVSYAGERVQFGRLIGSFQAVKHACADMLVQISVSRELVAAAVRSVAGNEPDAVASVAMAKSYTCDAAVGIVGKAMQLHGGIGYTWDSGIHVCLKRATLNRSLFGSPRTHRKALAQRHVGQDLTASASP